VREECEAPWPPPTTPRLAGELPDALRHAIEPFVLRRALLPTMRLCVQRATRHIERDGAPLGELALDHVTAHAAGHGIEFEEIEFELGAGDADQAGLVPLLRQRFELADAEEDKPTRAAALLGLPPPRDHGETDAAGARGACIARATRSLLLAVRSAEPAARTNDDPEAIHRMRVAVRKLRNVLATYDALWPESEARWLANHLRALGRELGRVRNIDAALLAIPTVAGALPPALAAEIEHVTGWLRALRASGRDHLVAWLSSSERLDDAQHLHELLLRGPDADLDEQTLRADVERRIRRQVRRLRRRALRLGDRPEHEQVHALRIAGKRLRYLCEQFGDALALPTQKIRRRLARLQDLLGRACDLTATASTLTALTRRLEAETPSPALAFACGALAQALHGAAEAARCGLSAKIAAALPRKPD
jgi:CHAD domain-containing protein